MKPFLKWAGSKYKIMNHIAPLLPPGRRLLEPFCGSCAVFLNTDYDEYLLSDINPDLISLYQVLAREGRTFIEYVKELFVASTNDADVYYELRHEFNTCQNEVRKAALFLYLNRHGYNGLCRYNNSGQFNVPFGRYRLPYFPHDEMVAFYDKSNRARFVTTSFTQVMEESVPGDVIYCDPPYVPLSPTAKFTSYSAGGFGEDKQLQLAQLAELAASRGIPVLVSNHLSDFTLGAYRQAQIQTLEVRRLISRDGKNRNMAREVLALFAGAAQVGNGNREAEIEDLTKNAVFVSDK